ncbi:unnamed protein product [Prunus armeniaca]
MKTDEACTHRGMWCVSDMKRQRNEHEACTPFATSDQHPRQFLDRSLVEELFANNKIQAFLFYLSIGLYQHIGMGCKPSRSSSGHH